MKRAAQISIKLLAVLITGLALAGPSIANEAKRYRECVQEALDNPIETFVVAAAWRDEGGGAPAEHCLALVLTALERFEPAAKQLESVAKHIKSGAGIDPFTMNITPALISDIWSQAGNAWLLAERGGEAYNAFSRALQEKGEDTQGVEDILIDRARANVLLGDYQGAIKDLDQAQLMTKERSDIYLYRAAAHRRLEDLSAAQADIEHALRYNKADANILLEAGNIAAAMERFEDARNYWLEAVQLSEAGEAVIAAQANLAELDIHFTKDSENNK